MEAISNSPALWVQSIPVPGPESHKYMRGHVALLGGDRLTGAARLASEAAMRIGAGLCTIVTSDAASTVYREAAPHIMVEVYDALARFSAHLDDPRRNAVLIGPGAGRDDPEGLKTAVLETLALHRGVVLDADALSVFAGEANRLFAALYDNCVLTPHEGEFERLFGMLPGASSERAVAAARASQAVVVLKGAETVIAHPDGRVVVNRHASPYLASAGTGDVLAGMIAGLMAQGVEAFTAACAAVWIHGEAAIRHGPGLVAPDLVAAIPGVLKDMVSPSA